MNYSKYSISRKGRIHNPVYPQTNKSAFNNYIKNLRTNLNHWLMLCKEHKKCRKSCWDTYYMSVGNDDSGNSDYFCICMTLCFIITQFIFFKFLNTIFMYEFINNYILVVLCTNKSLFYFSNINLLHIFFNYFNVNVQFFCYYDEQISAQLHQMWITWTG